MKKLVSVFLLATILTQSCIVYQKTSVSINEALDKGNVKVTNNLGQYRQFKNIYLEGGIYYGIVQPPFWGIDIPFTIAIDSANISDIYMKDIGKSNNKSLVFVIVSIGFFILFFSSFN